ncbi:MAG: PstS family phosphate ABC transporter substrate-binding protein [bacterium]
MNKRGRKVSGGLLAVSCIVVCLLIGSAVQAGRARAKESAAMGEGEELAGTIAISGAWALYPMAVKWAEEFQKIHPKVRIDIAAGGAGKGMADALAGVVDIGMVSRDIHPAEIEKGAWWISVVKDAVVPTINDHNPALKEILKKGVKKEILAGIWISGTVKSWSEVIGGNVLGSKVRNVYGKNDIIHVYTRSDACGAAETWAKYLGKNQEDLLGIGVYGDPGLVEAVGTDSLGIGFNNINYAYNAKTKAQAKGILVLPIDLNGNGLLDEDENFYRDRDAISKNIAEGKYPSPPARALHFVSQGRPRQKVVSAFMAWVLTDGQKYVPEAGYINLTAKKLQEELKNLGGE